MIRSKILREAVGHWNSHFTGITGLDLTHRTSIPHTRVLRILRNLEQRGLGQCRALEARKGPFTVMFFPGAGVLEEEFKRAGVDHGRYANLLHLRESQVALRYFGLAVLGKYLEQQENYHFEDRVIGGWIGTRDQYYFSLPEDTRDAETFGRVEYGKRTLKNGGSAVAAILKDLAALPRNEQKYWESFELDSPEFAAEDPDFDKFVQEAYGGEFVDDDDPLRRVYELLADINSMFAPDKVFKNDGHNPHLRYPVLNNHKSYSVAHKELWKLIGPDSLNRCLIERLLTQRNTCASVSDDEGTLSKFGRLLASFDPSVGGNLISPFKNCRDARTEDAHKVGTLELPAEDYVKRFRQECLALVGALRRIRDLLAGSP